MNGNTTRAGAPVAPRDAGANPWLIAVLVAFASFMEQLDTTIANVVLPYIAGGLGVSQDEASWVVTTYLVANAVALTASSFLARLLGRRSFFLTCLALFTASSVLCGYAWNLDALLLFRLAQGLGGGGMVPLAQSILADSFPPEKRGQAFALFGVAVVVAPVVGPTLGGWLADNFSWHWCFMINGPIGVLALALIAAILPAPKDAAEQRKRLQEQGGFDLVGFVLVATSRRNPMIDLRMVATRQFGACFVVMLASGAILLATTQFVPNLVQQDFGYTATWAGIVMSPGGFVMMVMMFIVGPLTAKVQPKYLIVIGAVITALSMYDMTNVYSDLDFWFFARSRMLLSLGLPLVFLPVITVSYDGIPSGKTDQASALLNAAKNSGGSIGISLASNVLAHREQFHQSRLIDQAIPSSVQYQDTLHRVTNYFVAQGGSLWQAHQQAIQWIGKQVQAQASLLAYMDAFWVLMLLALAAVPLALTLRKVKLGAAASAVH